MCAGGLVSGLSATFKSISDVMRRNSTGNDAILLQLISSENNVRFVRSKWDQQFNLINLFSLFKCVILPRGRYMSWLLLKHNDFKLVSSLRRAGRWVSWLHPASSSVSSLIRPNSSGSDVSRLLEMRKICSGRQHISRGNTVNWLLLKSKYVRECNPRTVSGIERIALWYNSSRSKNANDVMSSGNSQNRFRDKSENEKKKIINYCRS
jgi:hypothetical protein